MSAVYQSLKKEKPNLHVNCYLHLFREITQKNSTDDSNKIDDRGNLYPRIKRWDINVTLRNQFCQEDPI